MDEVKSFLSCVNNYESIVINDKNRKDISDKDRIIEKYNLHKTNLYGLIMGCMLYSKEYNDDSLCYIYFYEILGLPTTPKSFIELKDCVGKGDEFIKKLLHYACDDNNEYKKWYHKLLFSIEMGVEGRNRINALSNNDEDTKREIYDISFNLLKTRI